MLNTKSLQNEGGLFLLYLGVGPILVNHRLETFRSYFKHKKSFLRSNIYKKNVEPFNIVMHIKIFPMVQRSFN
jgi:hypothetical protein